MAAKTKVTLKERITGRKRANQQASDPRAKRGRGARTLAVLLALTLVGLVMLPVGLMLGAVTMFAMSSSSQMPQCRSDNYAPISGPVRIPMTVPYRIGSGFGPRFHPILHIWRNHNGIDLTHISGAAPIVSAMNGQVTAAGYASQAGNRVVVKHTDNVETVYMHLSEISVSVGQQVTVGQQVGIEGSTGLSTARHLHWGVRVNGAYTDPVAWIESHGVRVDGTVPSGDMGVASATTLSSTTTAAGVDGFNAEQLGNAAEIIRAARDLGLGEWETTVGVMTAIGESTLYNIDYGDKVGPDSRGLFQQRDNGAWGTYADRMTPYIAATNFFKALIKVNGYRDMEPTIAAHKTQINSNPYHYRPYWDPAIQIVAAITNNPNLQHLLSNNGRGCMPLGGTPSMPTDCPPTGMASENRLQVTALNYLRCTKATFPTITDMGGYRENAIDKQGHPAGLAIDVMIPNWGSAQGIALGDQVAQWTIDNHEALNVKYLIWRQRQWTPSRGWTSMSDRGNPTANHYDHVHTTLLPPSSSPAMIVG